MEQYHGANVQHSSAPSDGILLTYYVCKRSKRMPELPKMCNHVGNCSKLHYIRETTEATSLHPLLCQVLVTDIRLHTVMSSTAKEVAVDIYSCFQSSCDCCCPSFSSLLTGRKSSTLVSCNKDLRTESRTGL